MMIQAASVVWLSLTFPKSCQMPTIGLSLVWRSAGSDPMELHEALNEVLEAAKQPKQFPQE
jgi:hypothetical protein